MKPHNTRLITMLLAALTLCLAGCGDRQLRERFDTVERVVTDRPDSALRLLGSIKLSCLKDNQDRAMYGLLATMAKDKCHLDISKDSLIAFSADYFVRKNDSKRSILATYYYGRSRYQNGEMELAMGLFFRAKELAEKAEDWFMAGMSARGIADIYGEAYMGEESLKYAEEEYRNMAESRRQPYLDYAMLDLATAMGRAGKDTESIKLSRQVIDSAVNHQDKNLYYAAMRLIGTGYLSIDSPARALPVFREICSGEYAEPNDSMFLALSHVLVGETEKAHNLVAVIRNAGDIETLATRQMMARASGDIRSALQLTEQSDTLMDQRFRKRADGNLTSSAIEYYTMKSRAAEAEASLQSTLKWIVIFAAILFIAAVSLTAYILLRRHRHKREEAIIMADSLRTTVAHMKEEEKDTTRKIEKLFSDKYSILEQACAEIEQLEKESNSHREVTSKITSLMEKIRSNDKEIKNIEKEIDDSCGNLMTDLRTDLPRLKEQDYRLFLYSILGFSSSLTAKLLDEKSITSIYNRRRRLKDKIRTLDKEKSERYLQYL